MAFLQLLASRAENAGRRVVLAEGHDRRVREAALRLQDAGHIDPILLVPDSSTGAAEGWTGRTRCPADDPDLDRYAELYRERRGAA